MRLAQYNRKRDFAHTPEPRGALGRGDSFVVQKHAARNLHYDFRLELDGVLLSWAVPKGPSLDPSVKRLAMQTEDHPLEYRDFEGVIPKGEYGGGSVLVWDRGRWTPEGDAHEGYRLGRLTFSLEGQKLHGRFHLVRTRGAPGKRDGKSWLLIKSGDAVAERGSDTKLVDEHPASVLTGRTLQQVERNPDRVWHSNREAPAPRAARTVKRARASKVALPDFVAPQLATLVEAAPEGDAWLHELKLDGYRILARIDHGKVRLLTRHGHDWSARMPSVARMFAMLPFSQALIDGELCVLRADGASDFQRLQNSLQAGRDDACTYFAFDLLFLDDRDLRALPLLERKQQLRAALAGAGTQEGRLRYNDHVAGGGPRFFAQACKLGVEGVVSKRADAAYSSGRSRAWLKTKCVAREEFVIGGYTDPSGSRGHFGALLLGSHDARGALRYAGKVGTGFTQQSLSELHHELTRRMQRTPPFVNPPRGSEARGVHWLRPELVAEVQYAERTAEGLVRHASFQGLRVDKPAVQVHADKAVAKPAPARLSLTHPKRVLYPEQNITKLDLARYYLEVVPYMLPNVVHRPLMLVRCPEGHAAGCFFQKHPARGVPRAIGRVRVREKRAALDYMTIDSAEGLVGLVQLGALEIHTWGSRAETLECPDQLVFDLDPDEGLPWSRMIEAALCVRERLSELGLVAFLKTTGGKGLHLVVPIAPRTPWDAAKRFSKAVVDGIVRDQPTRYLATMAKHKRKGKVFLDYLRNGRGATAIAAYSTRARAGAPVSAPLAWGELTPELRSDAYTLLNMPERLAALQADPWRDFDRARRRISAAMQRAAGVQE